MSQPLPRLAPRSAGATADVALLRAARTDLGEPAQPARVPLAVRLRTLLPGRMAATAPVPVRAERHGA